MSSTLNIDLASCTPVSEIRNFSAALRTGSVDTPVGAIWNKPGSTPLEMEYGLRMPPDVYPIFENALRARRGLDRETHRRRMGALMSRFTQVAAKNPHAWFPAARSADELTLTRAMSGRTAVKD